MPRIGKVVFNLREMLIDVDEEKDIISAYQVGTDEVSPSVTSVVQKATLRKSTSARRI